MGLRARRGIALFVSMFFVAGIGALALSAIYLTANATLLSKTFEKEDDLKYVSEAALAIGKAELNFNPAALPNTSYVALMTGKSLPTADGQIVPGIKVNLYVGPSGSTSGQFGRFASIVAEARDANGTGFVRRLELSQESFAKFAYWTNSENTASGGEIVFASGDALWGPVWSNDTITIGDGGATFHDDVGTAAPIISNAPAATFVKGYLVKQKPIQVPSMSSLNTLSGLAAVGGFSFSAVTTGGASSVRQRVEFVAADLNGDGDSTDTNEGFFRVYTANTGNSSWLRGDFPGAGATVSSVLNCGDWHTIGGKSKFFPAAVHTQSWFGSLLSANHQTSDQSASLETIMRHSGARCFLGGDPHLVAVARTSDLYPNAADRQIGGDDDTFTPVDHYGSWKVYTGTPDATISAARPKDANYLFPLYRGFNTNTKGVIYFAGTVGVSGVVRGVVTLYSPNTIVVLDDLRYANDPAKGVCIDILGTISGDSTIVADNGINTPQDVHSGSGARWVSMDDTPGLFLHDVVMALNSFGVEHYNTGPPNALDCQSESVGRGCLYITGGLIQNRRGAVGLTSGQGYVKRYSYDHCAVVNPPPYFPTTGRFLDNRYYELDPNRVKSSTIGELYKLLTPE